MKKILLLLFSVTLLVSCEDLLNEIEEALSSFSATVTGDLSSTFEGPAEFAHVIGKSQVPPASLLTVFLENPDNSDEIITLYITLNNGDGIKAGTYDFEVDNTDQLVSMWYENTDKAFISPDPTKINRIIITSVEEARIKGSFTFNLVDLLGDENISGTGSFDAIGLTTTQ